MFNVPYLLINNKSIKNKCWQHLFIDNGSAADQMTTAFLNEPQLYQKH